MCPGANPERVQPNPNWPGIGRTKGRKYKCGNGSGATEPVALQRTPSCGQSRQPICPVWLINNVENMYQVAAHYLSSIRARYLSRRGQLRHRRSYHDMIWLRLSPPNCYYCWITLNFGYLNQIFPCDWLDSPSLELTLTETTKPTRNKGWEKTLALWHQQTRDCGQNSQEDSWYTLITPTTIYNQWRYTTVPEIIWEFQQNSPTNSDWQQFV